MATASERTAALTIELVATIKTLKNTLDLITKFLPAPVSLEAMKLATLGDMTISTLMGFADALTRSAIRDHIATIEGTGGVNADAVLIRLIGEIQGKGE